MLLIAGVVSGAGPIIVAAINAQSPWPGFANFVPAVLISAAAAHWGRAIRVEELAMAEGDSSEARDDTTPPGA